MMIHGTLYRTYNTDALIHKPLPVNQKAGNGNGQDDPDVVSVHVKVRFFQDGFIYSDSQRITKVPLNPLQPGRWLDCYA